jgi:propionyl-CoA carboxylase alpha chain
MADALDRTVIDGIQHNQPFLSALMAHERWREGRLSTNFIPEEFPSGFRGIAPDEATLHRLAAVALTIETRRRSRLKTLNGHLNGEGNGTRDAWVVGLGNERFEAVVTTDGICVAGAAPLDVDTDWRPGDPLWIGTVGGAPMAVQVRIASAGLRLAWRGVDVVARVMTPRVAELDRLMPEKKAADTSKALRAPMPGLVVSIAVDKGQKVHAGEQLAIVEAMKMENVLRAERDLTVKAIKARPGDTLAVDAVIMEFE